MPLRFLNTQQPKLSVIVNFYNMQREAKRTLYSLTPHYQRNIDITDYEVIAVDNGSTEPLDKNWVEALSPNFSYMYVDYKTASPAKAINAAVKKAKGKFVMCNIDGARILSPQILYYTLQAIRAFTNPFIYTLGMHIGHQVQNKAILEGYNQDVEDKLLDTVTWQENGYTLFTISSLALSSAHGFYSKFSESNCFALSKQAYLDIGGFDERFTSKGGGLINLDIFRKSHELPEVSPVMLLGEATFHQFHGGVATNVPLKEHPWDAFAKEYKEIKGKEFVPFSTSPHLFGHVPEECKQLLADSTRAFDNTLKKVG